MFDLKDYFNEIAVNEFMGLSTIISKKMVNKISKNLPQEVCEIYRDTWYGEIERMPTAIEKLTFAIEITWSIKRLNAELSGTPYSESQDFKRKIDLIMYLCTIPAAYLYFFIPRETLGQDPIKMFLLIFLVLIMSAIFSGNSTVQLYFFVKSLRNPNIDLNFKIRLKYLFYISCHAGAVIYSSYLLFSGIKIFHPVMLLISIISAIFYIHIVLKLHQLESDELVELTGIRL